ncbi:MAG: IS3 family transposase, partial [bacterium]
QTFTRYGYRRMTAQLRLEGERINSKRVRRLMRQAGLCCRQHRSARGTTVRDMSQPIYANLYPSRAAIAPNQIWVTDLTYVKVHHRWAYLAVVLDVFSRRVVGWALGTSPDGALTLQALIRALRARPPEPGCLHHSDRGGTYSAPGYVALLKHHGFEISMSRKACPTDNPVMESFFATLKKEEISGAEYATLDEAQRRIGRFIDKIYNPIRLHSALNYRSPMMFETNQNQTQALDSYPPTPVQFEGRIPFTGGQKGGRLPCQTRAKIASLNCSCKSPLK